MEHTVRINTRLEWQLKRTSQGGFLAVCEPLGLALEADDEGEARSLIEEGLHYFFLDHLEDGTLDQFLQSKGWERSSALPMAGHEPSDIVRFDVPWTVASNQHAP